MDTKLHTYENFNQSSGDFKLHDITGPKFTESQVNSTVISGQAQPYTSENINNKSQINPKSQMFRASISIGEITTSGAANNQANINSNSKL